MRNIRQCTAKTHADLSAEWDLLAGERHRQIVSGEDLSFEHVVAPMTLSLLHDANTELVIDIGSGTGDLTARLAKVAARVIGIEPSADSLSIAMVHCHNSNNVSFINKPLEESASTLSGIAVTAAVACMTLMTTPDLKLFASALASALAPDAKFVATLCHPCYWPKYWEYETKEWFNYDEEIFIEAPFAISRCTTEVMTTHVHRPLSQYMNVFAGAGFRLEIVLEPMPSREIAALYPQPWRYPRFIGLRWTKAA